MKKIVFNSRGMLHDVVKKNNVSLIPSFLSLLKKKGCASVGVSLKEGGRIIRTHFAYNGKLFWITAKNTKFENAESGSSLRGDLT